MGMLVIPVSGDSLGSGVEADAVQAQHMLIAEEGILVAGEGEIRRGHGDAHIDADHAAVGEHLKLTGIVTVLGKDDRTVGKGIGIHQRNALFKALDPLDEGDRPKDLAVAHGHLGRHMIQDGGADKEAILKAGDHNVTSVQNQLRALIDALLDPVADGTLISSPF